MPVSPEVERAARVQLACGAARAVVLLRPPPR